MDSRQICATAWLQQHLPLERYGPLTLASADASRRRYFRISPKAAQDCNHPALIVMDAPPEHEPLQPFLNIRALFEKHAIRVPKLYAQDLQQGFLLLEDLGNCTYQQALQQCKKESERNWLYQQAGQILGNIQKIPRPDDLPDYSEHLLRQEMQLFTDWYSKCHLKLNLTPDIELTLNTVFDKIIERVCQQPYGIVHRDYHCRNLMYQHKKIILLDFQDAIWGPITYDVVSLFKDAYIQWPEYHTLPWLIRIWKQLRHHNPNVSKDFTRFFQNYEWMGVQRHLKVLGIFARLHYRDQKSQYLDHLPQVLYYLMETCQRYQALNPLHALLHTWHPAASSFMPMQS